MIKKPYTIDFLKNNLEYIYNNIGEKFDIIVNSYDIEKEEFIYIVKSATDDIVGSKEEKVIKNLCKNVYINEKIIKEI